MNLKKILLVEDDPFDARLIRMSLEKIPLANEVVWLETGEELIEYLEAHGTEDICLIILDIRMPVMDGIEALTHMRHEMQLDFGPVVVLTSSKDDRDIERAYKLGVSAFVTKPINHEEFRRAVHTLGLFWALMNERPKT
jgi:CheY-like chemotaxis protein